MHRRIPGPASRPRATRRWTRGKRVVNTPASACAGPAPPAAPGVPSVRRNGAAGGTLGDTGLRVGPGAARERQWGRQTGPLGAEKILRDIVSILDRPPLNDGVDG